MASLVENEGLGSGEVQNLIDLCIDVLIQHVKPKHLDQIMSLYSHLDLNHEKMGKIRSYILKHLHNFFPLLLERYGRDELQKVFDEDLWRALHNGYEENLRAKRQFAALKGTIIQPAVVKYTKNQEFYPLDVLVKGVVWPPNVQPDRRESYLSPDDFYKVFGMTKQEFQAEAKYVRIRMKKEKNLF